MSPCLLISQWGDSISFTSWTPAAHVGVSGPQSWGTFIPALEVVACVICFVLPFSFFFFPLAVNMCKYSDASKGQIAFDTVVL